MGVTQNQLSGIEYKRTRLQFGMAKLLCEKFDINQRWLALGEAPIQPKLDISMEYSITVKYSSYFSWVFDNFLDHLTGIEREALIESIGRDAYENGKNRRSVLPDPRDAYAEGTAAYVMSLINLRLRSLPESLRQEYAIELLYAEECFRQKHQGEIPLSISIGSSGEQHPIINPKQIGKLNLTKWSTQDDVTVVQNQWLSWQDVKQRIQKATKLPGSKTALADLLHVDITQLSRWLSDSDSAREPGADYALKMLDWVQRQERKNHNKKAPTVL
jgi:transcriptional regulator with XRE-family HTH domain